MPSSAKHIYIVSFCSFEHYLLTCHYKRGRFFSFPLNHPCPHDTSCPHNPPNHSFGYTYSVCTSPRQGRRKSQLSHVVSYPWPLKTCFVSLGFQCSSLSRCINLKLFPSYKPPLGSSNTSAFIRLTIFLETRFPEFLTDSEQAWLLTQDLFYCPGYSFLMTDFFYILYVPIYFLGVGAVGIYLLKFKSCGDSLPIFHPLKVIRKLSMRLE